MSLIKSLCFFVIGVGLFTLVGVGLGNSIVGGFFFAWGADNAADAISEKQNRLIDEERR